MICKHKGQCLICKMLIFNRVLVLKKTGFVTGDSFVRKTFNWYGHKYMQVEASVIFRITHIHTTLVYLGLFSFPLIIPRDFGLSLNII